MHHFLVCKTVGVIKGETKLVLQEMFPLLPYRIICPGCCDEEPQAGWTKDNSFIFSQLGVGAKSKIKV